MAAPLRTFLVLQPVKGGGDRVICSRLSRDAARVAAEQVPDGYVRKMMSNKNYGLSDVEMARLNGTAHAEAEEEREAA